jgi:hypothetical protein
MEKGDLIYTIAESLFSAEMEALKNAAPDHNTKNYRPSSALA